MSVERTDDVSLNGDLAIASSKDTVERTGNYARYVAKPCTGSQLKPASMLDSLG